MPAGPDESHLTTLYVSPLLRFGDADSEDTALQTSTTTSRVQLKDRYTIDSTRPATSICFTTRAMDGQSWKWRTMRGHQSKMLSPAT